MNLVGMSPRGYAENVTVDEGVSAFGVRKQVHFEGDSVIVQKTYDAAPHLEHARIARESTEGKRWGEGKLIGHIPPVEYARISVIRDPAERRKAIMTFLRENPAFVMFDRALK